MLSGLALGKLWDMAQKKSDDELQSNPRTRRTKRSATTDLEQITPALEDEVGVTLGELMPLMALDAIKGFGPQKFRALHASGVSPEEAIRQPDTVPLSGKTGSQLRAQLKQVGPDELRVAKERAARQMAVAADLNAKILTYGHPHYPSNVLASNNAIPVLYARGDLAAFDDPRAIACVGSRGIRLPYSDLQAAFAKAVVRAGGVVVAGFALGADTIAHRAAMEDNGRTIGVMPGGLDRPFPPENRALFNDLISAPGAVFISEFPFGTGASAMNLRKRNKLIVAAAKGVLVGQSSDKGGAMNAFRFGIEQRKPVATFADDGTESTAGNRQIAAEKRAGIGFPGDVATDEWEAWLAKLF